MPATTLTLLVVGATGSIGRLVVAEAIRAGHDVCALVRNPAKASPLSGARIVVGDVTHPETLAKAVAGIDAVVFTLGSDGTGKAGAENVDHNGVRNVLHTLGQRPVRIALMTSIGVTNRLGDYNIKTEAHDWKRRAERLVRASGHAYTIVRPGWFDYNAPEAHKLVFLQGDTHQAGDSRDGAIARTQIAEVLVRSLQSPQAIGKTFELIAERGVAQTDLGTLFEQLAPDDPNQLDGVGDMENMPLEREPERVRSALAAMRANRNGHVSTS